MSKFNLSTHKGYIGMKYWLFILFWFAYAPLNGQDSLAKASVLHKWEELRVGIDVKPLLQSALSNGFQGGSAFAEASFDNKIFLAAQWGFANSNRSLETQPGYSYQSGGQFLQLQISRNVLYSDFANDALALGLAYGIARFNQKIVLPAQSFPWGEAEMIGEKKGNMAHWLEGTCTLGVKPSKRLCLQAVFRVRLLLAETQHADFKTAEIPGFGFYKSRGGAGVAYRLLYVFGK